MSLVKAIVESERAIEDGKHIMSVLDPAHGDLRLTWDPDVPDEVAEVERVFNEKTGSGMVAYSVKRKGAKGTVMKKFDPEAGAVIIAPALRGG